MKIISTTISHESIDYDVWYSVSLVDIFGLYGVVMAQKTDGECETDDVYMVCGAVDDLELAKYIYKEYGGILEE